MSLHCGNDCLYKVAVDCEFQRGKPFNFSPTIAKHKNMHFIFQMHHLSPTIKCTLSGMEHTNPMCIIQYGDNRIATNNQHLRFCYMICAAQLRDIDKNK
jgi:hypothetical protein